MPYAYMVRVTHPYQDASGVVALWSSRAEKMVVYEHVGTVTEKIHIHMVIFGSDTHKKQLRNIGMATGLDLKGNKNCSFKEFDGNERCFVYMTKGRHDPSFIKGYTMPEHVRWKGLYEVRENRSNDARLYEHCFGDEEYNEAHFQDSDYITDPVYGRYKWVKFCAKTFVMMNNDFIWNMKATNMYKMLVYTYIFRHNNVIIPPNDPVFKIF